MTVSEGDRSGEVLVVGSVNVDLVVQVTALPQPGETVTGGRFAQHSGGKGANQAVAAARLGAHVTFVGAVGDDEFGAAALSGLRAENVDVSRALKLAGSATGVALIVVDERGENLIAVAPGANAALSGELVEETLGGWQPAAPAKSGVVLATFEIPDEAVIAAALLARQLGMRMLLNPAPARALPAALVELAPILLPNEGEARSLSRLAEAGVAARSLAEQTGAPVIVTLGEAGALVVEDGTLTRIAAPKVNVVDTTGAGDTFAGALAAELARGANLVAAASLAVAAASLSVTAAGARAGMPGRALVGRLMKSA